MENVQIELGSLSDFLNQHELLVSSNKKSETENIVARALDFQKRIPHAKEKERAEAIILLDKLIASSTSSKTYKHLKHELLRR